tara:strand:+ start:94 stop:576 length:483 start_codon:yes stop_codon:yes gene_type:complete
MFFLQGIISGLIATFLFDLYQISLSYAYNINKPKWNLVGRYFIGITKKNYFIENIESEKEITNELIIGYIIHYLIGLIFGAIYLLINKLLYVEPSIILALIIGFITVLGSWCIMMPLAYNMGFFASKKEEQKQIMVQNLIAHFIFGIGLYLGYVVCKYFL